MDRLELNARRCVVGGGPAGMMLGFLLALAGVDVIVLERHCDFLRDFRGDTIHPSTLQLMRELEILDEFLLRPHQELSHIGGQIGEFTVPIAGFSHLPTRCQFIALMPQWDFLNFIAGRGKLYPRFHLRMYTHVTGLIEDIGRIAGVRAETPQGPLEARADLSVGADGRHSTVRREAGLDVIDPAAPIDVLWMRLARPPGGPIKPSAVSRRGEFSSRSTAATTGSART